MCGIFGVHGHADAPQIAQLGLYSLQHRGQESVGIVVDRRQRARRVPCGAWARCPMRVAQRADASSPACPPSATRDTARRARRRSRTRSPSSRARKGGYITLAHNGNSINAAEMRHASSRSKARSSRRRTTPKSSSTASRGRRADTPAERLRRCAEGRRGRVQPDRRDRRHVLAARDPRGWRPLAMGRLGDAVVFASETCALDIVGATIVRDVEPGEIVSVERRLACSRFIRCPSRRLAPLRVRVRVLRATGQPRFRRLGRLARVARSGGASRGSTPRRTPISCSAFPIRPTPRRSASPRRAGCRTSSRSFAITTSAERSFSRRRRGATQRSR